MNVHRKFHVDRSSLTTITNVSPWKSNVLVTLIYKICPISFAIMLRKHSICSAIFRKLGEVRQQTLFSIHAKFQLDPFTVRYIFATWCNLSVLSMPWIVMEKRTEQRAAICFGWKTGFNATKTFEMIQKVYGESAVHRVTVFHWYNVFSEERKSIRDEQKSRRPMTTRMHENIAHIANILKKDRQSLCRLITK